MLVYGDTELRIVGVLIRVVFRRVFVSYARALCIVFFGMYELWVLVMFAICYFRAHWGMYVYLVVLG